LWRTRHEEQDGWAGRQGQVIWMWNRSSRLEMMFSRIDRKRKEMKWKRTDGGKAERKEMKWKRTDGGKAESLESCSNKLV